MRIRSKFCPHAAGERLGAETPRLPTVNPRKWSFYRPPDVKTRFMPRLSEKNRAVRISSAAKTRTLHSRPPLYRFQEIFHAIKTGQYPNRTKLAETIEVTTKTIQRDIDYMRYQMSVPIDLEQIVLRFSSRAAQLVRERNWHSSQQIQELADGSVELSLTLNSLEEIIPWILSGGEDCEVVKPGETSKEG